MKIIITIAFILLTTSLIGQSVSGIELPASVSGVDEPSSVSGVDFTYGGGLTNSYYITGAATDNCEIGMNSGHGCAACDENDWDVAADGSFSFGAWCNSSFSTTFYPGSKMGTTGAGYRLGFTSTGALAFTLNDGSLSGVAQSTAGAVSSGWHYVGGMIRGGTYDSVYLFVDDQIIVQRHISQLNASWSDIPNMSNSVTLTIAGWGYFEFNGAIDEFFYANTFATAAQMREIAGTISAPGNPVTVLGDNTITWFRFEEGTGVAIDDLGYLDNDLSTAIHPTEKFMGSSLNTI